MGVFLQQVFNSIIGAIKSDAKAELNGCNVYFSIPLLVRLRGVNCYLQNRHNGFSIPLLVRLRGSTCFDLINFNSFFNSIIGAIKR